MGTDTALPGMPDRLPKTPPKSVDYSHYTLDEAIARSHHILDQVIATYPAERILILLSGGRDSTVFAHLMRNRADTVVHINTGIGVAATHAYVREVAAAWRLLYMEAHPPAAYRDLVLGRVLSTQGDRKGDPVWRGFPGPAAHYLMYQRLKERALAKVRRSIVGIGRRGQAGQIVYLAGMRWGESQRRFRTANEVDADGAVVWVSPIVHWTDDHMREYRDRNHCHLDHTHAQHRLCTPDALPHNEVTDHLHMSGDCLCGAYATEGEIHGLELFYPDLAARLHALEAEAATAPQLADLPRERCTWGWGADRERATAGGRLCSKCVPVDGQDALPGFEDTTVA